MTTPNPQLLNYASARIKVEKPLLAAWPRWVWRLIFIFGWWASTAIAILTSDEKWFAMGMALIVWGITFGVFYAIVLLLRNATGWLRLGISGFISLILGPILILFMAAIIGAVFIPVHGILAWGVGLGLLFAWGRMLDNIRQRRVGTVLGYLAQSTRLNQPLPALLDAAAKSESGRTSAALVNVREMLVSGYSVSMAVAAAVPEVSPRVLAMLDSGERLGRLPKTLGRLAREHEQHQRQVLARHTLFRYYPLYLGCFAVLILNGMLLFVVPKFRDIFADFKVQLPSITKALLNASDFFSNQFFEPELFYLLGMLLSLTVGWLVLASLYNRLFHHVRFPRIVPLAVRDFVLWHVPFYHQIERDRGLTDVLGVLHESIAAGLPGTAALEAAARIPVNQQLQQRIGRWADGVQSGLTFSDAAEKARLPAILVGMLRTSQEPAETLAFLERYYRSRFSRLALFLQSAMVPLMVVAMGLFVALIVLAFFLPLVVLINSVAGLPTPGVF